MAINYIYHSNVGENVGTLTILERLFDEELQESDKSMYSVLHMKCSTLHMEHCVQRLSEEVQYPHFQSDTQHHTGMLVHPVHQLCRWSTVAALVDRDSLLHLLFHYKNCQLPFQRTVVVFQ